MPSAMTIEMTMMAAMIATAIPMVAVDNPLFFSPVSPSPGNNHEQELGKFLSELASNYIL